MLVAKVQACINTHAMLSHGARVVVAVSGGPDSMALLSVLYRLRFVYGLTLIVAHVNHQLRGEEACQDATFVERQAASLGLSFYQTKVDVKAFQYASGLSPQHAARHLRYDFLLSLLQTLKATHIALGHTADDQAETVLIRLLRGGGPVGLSGIPAVRLPFVRPLILSRRHSILSYLETECIPWVDDRSNAHRKYLRNRIRLDLLPDLQQYNPKIVKRLNELSEMLRADNIALEQQTDTLAKRTVRWYPAKRVEIQCESYRTTSLSLQRRLLRRIFDALLPSHVTVGFHHIESLRQHIVEGPNGKRLGFPGGILAERHQEAVMLWQPQRFTAMRARILTMQVPGCVEIPELQVRLVADVAGPHGFSFNNMGSTRAYIDLERIHLPLIVRFPQPGDRFYPLGAPGWKKLQDFFIDKKVPRAERQFIPLVLSGTEIVWIVNYQIAESVKIRSKTKRVLRLWSKMREEL